MSFLIYMIIPMLLVGWAQMRVRGAFKKYSRIRSTAGISGAETARRILRDAVAVMAVGEQMVIDARRGASKSSGGSTPSRQDSGHLSPSLESELGAAARGLLRSTLLTLQPADWMGSGSSAYNLGIWRRGRFYM